ncbi:venom protein 164-like [Argiope bruennichi]|uniref:venom protein 164-like n=1 Tax=Argiope bruennichi TaxID=94029 RepID=UPI002495977D|nr:venom protein 164-like [Argiope bruennichi]
MVTKMLLRGLLLVILAGYAMGGCNSQADCPRHYCCAKKAFVEGEFNCVPNRKKNELCLNGGEDEVLYDGKFDITCPCDEGLQCIKFTYPDGQGGFVSKGVPTCRNLTEDRILMRRKVLQRQLSNSKADAGASSFGQRRK